MARQGEGSGEGLPRLAIPRRFHFMWFGGELPEHLWRYVLTWIERHPHWEFTLWNEAGLPFLVNQDLFDRAEEVAPGSEGQLRSDVARYEILHRYGGVYVDCDFECQKPIELLLHDIECFAAWEDQDRWIANGLMGCVPDHPFLELLIDELPENAQALAGPGIRPNKLTGPQYLTRQYRRNSPDMRVFSQELFYPYNWDELDRNRESFPDAYAVHHWHNMRKRRA